MSDEMFLCKKANATVTTSTCRACVAQCREGKRQIGAENMRVMANRMPHLSIQTVNTILEDLKQPPDLFTEEEKEQIEQETNKQLADLIFNQNILKFIMEKLDKPIIGEQRNKILLFIIDASVKFLKKPLNASLISTSASGKSHLMNEVANYFPQVEIVPIEYLDDHGHTKIDYELSSDFGIMKINDITPAALFRLSLIHQELLKGKIILMNELPENASDDQKQTIQYFRQLISEGEIRRIITDKNTLRPLYLHLIGSPALICADANTDLKNVDDQFLTRLFLLNLDESSQQTKGILDRLADEEMSIKTDDVKDWICDLLLLRRFIEFLPILNVWNPFAKILTDAVHEQYPNYVQLRRLGKLVLHTIRVITLFHQFNREKVLIGNEIYVITSLIDVKNTITLLDPIIHQSLKRTLATGDNLLKFLEERYGPEQVEEETGNIVYQVKKFTVREIASDLDTPYKTIFRYIKNLFNSAKLNRDEANKPHQYWLNESPVTFPNLSLDRISILITRSTIKPFLSPLFQRLYTTPQMETREKTYVGMVADKKVFHKFTVSPGKTLRRCLINDDKNLLFLNDHPKIDIPSSEKLRNVPAGDSQKRLPVGIIKDLKQYIKEKDTDEMGILESRIYEDLKGKGYLRADIENGLMKLTNEGIAYKPSSLKYKLL